VTVLRTVGRWVTDWRNGAVIAASLLAGGFLFFVVDASRGRHDALQALKANAAQSMDIREAQSQRITGLQDDIRLLTDEVVQLRQMLVAAGVDPPPRTATTRRRPSTTTTTVPRRTTTTTTSSSRPSPSTTSTTNPPPPAPSTSTTTTTRPCAVSIPGVCL